MSDEVSTTPTMNLSRDSLRTKIFASHKPSSIIVEFFDAQIEIRQPTLADIITARDAENQEASIIETLLRSAYVPGTDQRVFEDTDADALKNMPFGPDFIRVSQALAKLSDVNFQPTNAN